MSMPPCSPGCSGEWVWISAQLTSKGLSGSSREWNQQGSTLADKKGWKYSMLKYSFWNRRGSRRNVHISWFQNPGLYFGRPPSGLRLPSQQPQQTAAASTSLRVGSAFPFTGKTDCQGAQEAQEAHRSPTGRAAAAPREVTGWGRAMVWMERAACRWLPHCSPLQLKHGVHVRNVQTYCLSLQSFIMKATMIHI